MLDLDPPGTCDDGGRCCQTLCSGYSKADLFPTPNTPRCGLELGIGQWCTDNLEQKFRFTSESGQISLQVMENCDPKSPGKCGCSDNAYGDCTGAETVSSYNGSKPVPSFINGNETDAIVTNVDFTKDSGFILNTRFHKNDKPSPEEEWFVLNVNGPGAPESAYGTFVWLATIRHAVLAPWLMQFLSYGILAPTKDEASVNINPGFCPTFVDPATAAFNRRLVRMQKTLLRTVQAKAGSLLPIAIPYGSQIAFMPRFDKPKIFVTDPVSSDVSVVYVESFDYPLLVALLALGLCVPLVIASALTISVFTTLRAYLFGYRRSQVRVVRVGCLWVCRNTRLDPRANHGQAEGLDWDRAVVLCASCIFRHTLTLASLFADPVNADLRGHE